MMITVVQLCCLHNVSAVGVVLLRSVINVCVVTNIVMLVKRSTVSKFILLPFEFSNNNSNSNNNNS